MEPWHITLLRVQHSITGFKSQKRSYYCLENGRFFRRGQQGVRYFNKLARQAPRRPDGLRQPLTGPEPGGVGADGAEEVRRLSCGGRASRRGIRAAYPRTYLLKKASVRCQANLALASS